MAAEGALVWVDMEMSGLDPDRDVILEIAVVVTDGQLNVIENGPGLVVHQPESVLEGMDDWNKKHHGASGLLAAVRAATLSVGEAEEQVLAFVKRHCGERSTPLAGNSIHQDRSFLRHYMPKLEAYLHYRNVDVSTVKELARRWSPDALRSAPTKQGGHRALQDILESIAELKHYRDAFFKLPQA